MLAKHSYCMKCQTGKTIIGQSPVIMKNGSMALKGECPSCKTTSYKIVGKAGLVQNTASQQGMLALNTALLVVLSISAGMGFGVLISRLLS
jgi:hypothetical protein